MCAGGVMTLPKDKEKSDLHKVKVKVEFKNYILIRIILGQEDDYYSWSAIILESSILLEITITNI